LQRYLVSGPFPAAPLIKAGVASADPQIDISRVAAFFPNFSSLDSFKMDQVLSLKTIWL
jgi:hypothetical protein